MAVDPMAVSDEVSDAKVESDDERLHRLHHNPAEGRVEDVAWLTTLVRTGQVVTEQAMLKVQQSEQALERARDVPGRVQGLREAAQLLRAAQNKEVKARVLVGKRENAYRAMNAQLMVNVATLIERYAADVEAKGGR